jgi:hypothetical protein
MSGFCCVYTDLRAGGEKDYEPLRSHPARYRKHLPLAPTKYRALELVGDYLVDAGQPHTLLQSGKFVVRQLDLSEEQILRPEKCWDCPLNE